MDSDMLTNWGQQILGNNQESALFCILTVLTITLLQPAKSVPKWSGSSESHIYEPVASDLQKLSVWFQRCHIHVIVKANDVPLHSIRNPYILTVPRGRKPKTLSIHQRCKWGRFAIPSSTKMTSPCQATFYINLFQISVMADTGKLRVAEECTRAYKLKGWHSIILTFKDKFELKNANSDLSAGNQGGGNTLLVLLYAQSSSSGGDSSVPAIQAGIFVCEQCVQLHHQIACTSVENCLRTLESTYGQAVQDGKAVTWAILPLDFRPTEQRTGKFSSFKNCLYPKKRNDLDCATFPKLAMMNYIVGGLNSSLATPMDSIRMQNLRLPSVAWSEDDLWIERRAMTMDMLQIQVYPMRSENRSRRNLKFITADGVKYKIPSLAMYTQPLDTGLWLGSLGFFILAVKLIIIVGKRGEGTSVARSAQWAVLWIYGAVLDQPLPVPRTQNVVRTVFVAQVLSVTYLLAYVMTNHYKAVLNVNYIAGKELVPLWHRIDQLLNFTTLYVLMGPCTWKIAEEYALIDKDDEVLSNNNLHFGCTMSLNQCCKGMEDEVPSVLSDEKDDLVWAGRGGVCSSYVHYMQRNGRKLKPMTLECQKKRINTLRSLNHRLKYIPVDQLASYVRKDLSKPRTAVLTTEAGLGLLWKEFEKTMEEDRGIKFSHNLFSPVDSTIANRDSRLQIVSGMKEEYTRVVTARVHNLLLTGIWDFWIDFGSCREKLVTLERFAVPDFAPLTMNHDGLFLLFVLTGILWGWSSIAFAAEFLIVWAENSNFGGYLRGLACCEGGQRTVGVVDNAREPPGQSKQGSIVCKCTT